MSIRLAWLLMLPWAAIAEVPVDRIPNTLSLPQTYPDSWVFVYSVSQPVVGTYAIVDVAATTKEYKGQFQGSFYPSLIDPVGRPELFVAESFFEAGSHGKRTDVLTVTQKSTLNPVAEIVLPGSKRGILDGNLLELTRDEKLLLLVNFTPASSVSVIDVQSRKVINEVPTPGCTSVYVSGARGFSSFCANGTLATFSLGAKGQVIRERDSTPFNDIDNDVLYLQPAQIGATTYFVSAKGNIRPVDLSGEEPSIDPSWPMVTPDEASNGWRPVDGGFPATDEGGRLYVRMYRETGYEKHVKDNTEVWVFDVSAHKRIKRIPLKNGGTSIEVTRGKTPYLVVTAESDAGADESLDVYDALTGAFVRTIGGWASGVPLYLVQAKR